jgi:hypothetical protein
MFVFGHVGVGRALLARWRDRLPAVPLIVGMLLPDVIDKPLYYSRLWAFVSCTRTFGHTGLLLAALVAAAYAWRSRPLAALSAGMATHLLLDCAFDWPPFGPNSSAWIALAWPGYSRDFALFYFPSIATHAARLLSSTTIVGEAAGLLLLGWELWRRSSVPATTTDSMRSRVGHNPEP